ncbi:gamma-glutamyltranspeptidase / glutathione hydrolase [Marisediminitalea aggregata]|uniref:Glutathione hydrolase proenzyme n=2 Tax=Marisediminitalea TaxID=2662254 RepID=A0A1M5NT61_9ALTE|nr:gamma-glutamyltransferase [Marisediminitalea aggregata]MEC7469604.1 gamma-glutamyltransferase [Pseudomonadota bacterium]SHG92143.1 gamma-glutamyltranspeptidase / glutathione hydrolase [Marisediminitalea aggregata]
MKIISRLLILLTFSFVTHAYDRVTGAPFASRSEVIAQQGMAATSQPLATQVALDILKQGGSAVDAAIAANAMLGLVEPTGCGIGGDLFAIVWDAETKQLHGLNASGRSPAALKAEYFTEQGLTTIPSFGPLPVSVPGAVDGWFSLHEKFGRLPMTSILSPAIEYARRGYPVSEVVAYYWQMNVDRIGEYEGFADVFMPNGKAPTTGQIFKNPSLAATYEKIATGGRDAFYKGDIARVIGAYMKEQGGFLSYEDLAAHTSEWVEPVSTNYRGYDVWELPPNGQGIAALQILNILEQYDIEGMGFGSADYIHTFVEAKKLAFEDRAKYYADPAFNDIPVSALISKDYAQKRRALINPDKAAKRYDAGVVEGDTIYLTVADKDGNMVSLIQSNYRGMGSGMTPPELGFILQNRGELFTLAPNHFNTYEPKKRPFHTIIPAMVTRNNKPWLSFGVMGGATQPQMHAQIVVNLIDFGMNLQEAGDAPRFIHVGSSSPTGALMKDGGELSMETGFATEVRRTLYERGHQLSDKLGIYGGYQAILYDADKQVYFGASESRKDGQAAGY